MKATGQIKGAFRIALVLLSFRACGQEGFLDDVPILYPSQIRVEFAVTNETHDWKLGVFRVASMSLTPAAISNLLTELNFSPTNRLNPQAAKAPLVDAFYSRQMPWQAWLRISPREGYVAMGGHSPKLARGTNDTIPPALEVMARASNILFSILGAKPTELRQRLNGELYFYCHDDTTSWLDRETKKPIKRVSARRISVARSIEGSDSVAGYQPEHFSMTVVDGGEITGLEFRWPPVEKTHPVHTPALTELKQIVEDGRARAQAEGIQRIVVERVDYYYERHGEYPAPVKYYPLARLVGQGYGFGTNRLIYIFCELPKPDL